MIGFSVVRNSNVNQPLFRMAIRPVTAVLAAILLTCSARAAEYHVSTSGNDDNPGSKEAPLRTVQAAAEKAFPGDTITVGTGVYRERVAPPRGGTSDHMRIIYQAAPGAEVVLKGSEPVTGWIRVENDTWKVSLPHDFFGDFNPFRDRISGDWFLPMGRDHHTGAVYFDGHWLTEAATKAEVMEPVGANPLWWTDDTRDAQGKAPDLNTTIWAQFKDQDPNTANIEINVRQTVFYPSRPGVNYITVRGFTLEQAATPWVPPTAEQIGLIGTHWSKGWIIENNTIRYSTCTGVTLGKYGDEWDNRSESADAYNQTIRRALENGWSKDTIGSHVVRNNIIYHCEQAGIAGSMGAVFSRIEGNEIHDIHVRRLFDGAEMAGIKIHGAIDTVIRDNHVYRTCRGIWLDWMSQGCRVTGNLLHDNELQEDLFIEVNHGPSMVDNNLFLSGNALNDISQGFAFAHNFFAGRLISRPNKRTTPYHKARSTEIAGLRDIPGGDHRFYNNIFSSPGRKVPWPTKIPANLNMRPYFGSSIYDQSGMPSFMAGNIYLGGAKPAKYEKEPYIQPGTEPGFELTKRDDGWYLRIDFGKEWAVPERPVVATELLGKAKIPELPYDDPGGSPYRIDTDYFGTRRAADNPYPGPFDAPDDAKASIKVWPKK